MRPASPHPSFFHSLNALRFLLAVCCLAGLALFVTLGVSSIGTPLTPGETITAGDLTLSLSAEGRITGLYEGDTGGANRRAVGRSTPLLSLVVEDSPDVPVSTGAEVHYRSQSWRYTAGTARAGETAPGSYLFRFADRIEVTVEVVRKPGYATLEVTAIANPEDKDIRLVLWGPLATDISAHVGETVGVVSDRDFAIGLIGVNARTLGGWPQQYPQTGLEAEAVGGAGQGGACRHDVAVCAALPATFGSMLQAYTRDYSVERVFKPWSAVGVEAPLPVAPLDGDQALHGQLVGSKVALFGVTRRGTVVGDESLRDVMDAAVLDRLGAIGSGEDLPHPIVSKVWGKQAEQANAPYLVFTDLSSANLDGALTLANDLGWQTVYRNTDWGAFDGGGLGVGSDFGGDDAGLRAAAQRTAARRVGLGSHSRFGAIPGSLAARHVADLLVTHYGVLDAELSAAATSLRLKPYPDTTATALRDAFPAPGVVRIGEELIAYGSVTPAAQGVLVLAGLQRGHEGTVAAVHAAGTRAGLLGRPAGQTGYLAGLGLLQDVLAPRLVTRLNQGVSTFAFDGSADLTRGGYGALGQHLVLEQVWRGLADREDFVHGAATALPYTWHLNTRYDWGVSAPDAVTDDVHYHRANQVYFRRNYLPPMLGWWRLDSANEWRRALAQAAVFDAGFAWFGSVAEASRLGAALRGEIRDWRNARLAGTFDRQSRFFMQAPAAGFRLDKVDHDRGIGPTWRLSDWAPSGTAGGRRSNGRYLAPQLRGFPLTNLARDAEVTVSGVLDNSYSGALAVDTHTGVGAVVGAPGLSGAGEWAIAGTASEKWIELTWDSPQKIRRIILFDRALVDQNVSAGTLTFTDADDTTSTLSVSGIPADGTPKGVDFAPKTVKQVRFTLTAVSGTAPGLAEFVALGPNPHYRDGTLAAGATVTGVTASEAARVTDGVIAAGTDAFATLAGNNAVLDLGGQYYLNGLAVWHYFDDARSYHDVVFEVADNEDFTDSTVVFNSDADNSLGLGAGTDAEYVESSAGKLVQFAPLPGRYIRLWSDGNTVNDDNHLTEVEVYGTGNGTTDITSGGVTSGNAAATGLGNVIDHNSATLADAGDGAQYIQLDLGREKTVNSLLVLRDNADMRTYKGVVYQFSTSADFSAGVTTVFHNDNDDLHGLGLGESTDTAYQETGNGRTVRFAPVSARYVRLYSAGSNYDNTNRYREVLVGTAQAGTAAPSAQQQPVADARSGSGGRLARSVTTTVKLRAPPAPATARSTPLGKRQVTPRQSSSTSLRAGDLTIHLNDQGRITALTGSNSRQYLPSGYTPALLKLAVANAPADAVSSAREKNPTSVTFSASKYIFSYDDGIKAHVKVSEHSGYASLALLSFDNPNGKDIRVAMWGPYELTIDQQVADVVGVAYSRDFAIGIQALNPKTFAGAPYEFTNSSNVSSFDRSADALEPEIGLGGGWGGRNAMNTYWRSAARLTTWGSVLQAYSRNWRTLVSRKMKVAGIDGLKDDRYVEQPGRLDDLWARGALEGSKIALFGVRRRGVEGGGLNRREVFKKEILTVIHKIELGEGVPYTTGNGGQWSKFAEHRKQRIARPLQLLHKAPNDARAQAQVALAAGSDSLYIWGGPGGVFAHTGSAYPVSQRYDGDLAVLNAAIAAVQGEGVRFGNHVLPGFAYHGLAHKQLAGGPLSATHVPGDPAIATEAAKLADKGRTTITRTITATQTGDIWLAGNINIFNGFQNYAYDGPTPNPRVAFAQIGDELIGYTGVTTGTGSTYKLTGAVRGVFTTPPRAYSQGTTIRVLHYSTCCLPGAFYWGDAFVEDQAEAVADSINDTNMDFISLDGIESYDEGVHGELTLNSFYWTLFENLDSKELTGEASRLSHHLWHFHDRYQWGEFNADLLKGTERFQRANSVLYARNFYPNGLGGYRFERFSNNDVEYFGSKVAALDAGILMNGITANNAAGVAKRATMKRWIEATEAGAFSDEQRAFMMPLTQASWLEEVESGLQWRRGPLQMTLTYDSDDRVTNVSYGDRYAGHLVARPWAGFPVRNMAGDALVIASSQAAQDMQRDNVVDGHTGIDRFDHVEPSPIQGVSEWAVASDDRERWIQVTWFDASRKVRAVMLSDRGSPNHNVNLGTVTMDAGTPITIDGLGEPGKLHPSPGVGRGDPKCAVDHYRLDRHARSCGDGGARSGPGLQGALDRKRDRGEPVGGQCREVVRRQDRCVGRRLCGFTRHGHEVVGDRPGGYLPGRRAQCLALSQQ